MAKLGAAWANDPRILAVQVGLIGCWGEHPTPAPRAKQRQLLTAAFQKAFKPKPVLVRHPKPEFMHAGFGVSYDTFATLARSPPTKEEAQFPSAGAPGARDGGSGGSIPPDRRRAPDRPDDDHSPFARAPARRQTGPAAVGKAAPPWRRVHPTCDFFITFRPARRHTHRKFVARLSNVEKTTASVAAQRYGTSARCRAFAVAHHTANPPAFAT